MDIGRKIYYEKTNGIIVWDKGEMSGSVVITTLDEDLLSFPVLGLVEPTQLGVKQLEYGEFQEKFNNNRGYKINPITEEIEFCN